MQFWRSLINNPVLLKELRTRMRGVRSFLTLSIYLTLLSGFTMLLYLTARSGTSNDIGAGPVIGKILFYGIMTVALIMVCVISPTLTAGSIVGERERQSIEVLFTTLLSPLQIIVGKLLAGIAFALLLILGILPVASLAFLFGGVSFTQLAIAIFSLLMTAIWFACVGMFWSTVMGSSLGANSLAIGSIILMLLGLPFLMMVFSVLFLSGSPEPWWIESPVFIYTALVVLSLHPFIALGLSALAIEQGIGTVFIADQPNGLPIGVPSPWVIYCVLAALLSAVLVALSVRMLRPGAPRGMRRPQRASTAR